MKKLTHKKLVEMLASMHGTAIVGLFANIDARANKTGNPFGAITKDIRAVGFVGADYGNAVKREGERQGADASSFVAGKLPWGEWHLAGKVISHKGGFYLRTQSTPGQRQRQPAKVLAYRDGNGQFVQADKVKPFLPVPSVSAKQSAFGIGTDAKEQVHVRTYAFDSIRKIRIAGKTFELVRE
jgi:hypothetical protein